MARAHSNELIAVRDRTVYDTVLEAIIAKAEAAGRRRTSREVKEP